MDVLDQLLVACHSHSLNLFVESFLKMVQKLLEFDSPDLQVLATQSVSISQIRPRKIILVYWYNTGSIIRYIRYDIYQQSSRLPEAWDN